MTRRPHDWRYRAAAYRSLPITFTRRVVFGRDPYWRQYFWSRWGYLPRDLLRLVKDRRTLWIEVLSGGEVTQAVTFCRSQRAALPDWAIVLSTNNKYSFDFAATNLAVDFIFDSPWDCRAAVRRSLRSIKPAAFVCVQNVACPRLVREARRAGVSTVLVSGLMSKNIHQHPMLQRAMEIGPFGDFDWIGAWGEDDVQGFISRGADPARVTVTGNMKFDFEFLDVPSSERRQLAAGLGLGAEEPVLLAASLHPSEEAFVGRAYLEARAAIPDLRLVLVPRYQLDVPDMKQTLASLGLDARLKTSLSGATAPRSAVLIVDTFGELSRLYAIASVVFLGGTTCLRNVVGLGQNPIEALVQRKPLFFGPYMNLWRDITNSLKDAWPGLEVETSRQLASGIIATFRERELVRRLHGAIDAVLAPQRDNVQRNVDLVVRVAGQRNAV